MRSSRTSKVAQVSKPGCSYSFAPAPLHQQRSMERELHTKANVGGELPSSWNWSSGSRRWGPRAC